MIGSCCHGEAGGGPTRSRASHVTGLKSIHGFPWLVLSWGSRGRIKGSCRSWTSPDHFVPVAAEVMVWLPGIVAAEVVGHNSIVTYGLAIAHLLCSVSHTIA